MKILNNLSYTQLTQIGAGQGANSIVYLIQEEQLGGTMAVKEILKAGFRSPNEFFEEAQRLHTATHPNVVPIRYACENATHVCLVLPYFKNGSLSDRIVAGPLTARESIRIAIGALAGVSHIHTCGLIHFDLKPSNLLFDDADEPHVTDFGQARLIGPLGTAQAPMLYSDTYPPEIYAGFPGSAQTDIYHFGLLLYRAVNGDPHYKAQVPNWTDHKKRTTSGKFPDRKRFLPHVNPRLRTIIRKALRVDPGERYQTAAEMSAALGRITLASDWKVNVSTNETVWDWERPGSTTIRVRLRFSSGSHEVDVFTVNAKGAIRKKDAARYQRSGLGEADAWKHLNDSVFPSLM